MKVPSPKIVIYVLGPMRRFAVKDNHIGIAVSEILRYIHTHGKIYRELLNTEIEREIERDIEREKKKDREKERERKDDNERKERKKSEQTENQRKYGHDNIHKYQSL